MSEPSRATLSLMVLRIIVLTALAETLGCGGQTHEARIESSRGPPKPGQPCALGEVVVAPYQEMQAQAALRACARCQRGQQVVAVSDDPGFVFGPYTFYCKTICSSDSDCPGSRCTDTDFGFTCEQPVMGSAELLPWI